MIFYVNLFSMKGICGVEYYDLAAQFSHFHNKHDIKINQKKVFNWELNFSSFLADFWFRAEVKKVTSWAENPSAPAMARASSARTHH
jgi:hypothetical protein